MSAPRSRLVALGRRLPPVVPQLGLRAMNAAAFPGVVARFARDWRAYRALPEAEPLRLRDVYPQLWDRLAASPFDHHYFFQDTWAARRVAEIAPPRHVDVGSRVDTVAHLTALCPVTFVDIRPLNVELEDFESVAGSVLELPFEDRSLPSVSCLHVAEHIGLGRYGDPLDPEGSRKAARELQRVVAPGGHLLFTGPMGRPRVCFNAHRIHDPRTVATWFDELELVEFASVDDEGAFRRHGRPDDLASARYGCGMFHLRRPPA